VKAMISISDLKSDNWGVLKEYFRGFATSLEKISLFCCGLPTELEIKMDKFLKPLRSLDKFSGIRKRKSGKNSRNPVKGYKEIARKIAVRAFFKKEFVGQIKKEFSHIPEDSSFRKKFFNGIFLNHPCTKSNVKVIQWQGIKKVVVEEDDDDDVSQEDPRVGKRKAVDQLDEQRGNFKKPRLEEKTTNPWEDDVPGTTLFNDPSVVPLSPLFNDPNVVPLSPLFNDPNVVPLSPYFNDPNDAPLVESWIQQMHNIVIPIL